MNSKQIQLLRTGVAAWIGLLLMISNNIRCEHRNRWGLYRLSAAIVIVSLDRETRHRTMGRRCSISLQDITADSQPLSDQNSALVFMILDQQSPR